MVGTSGFPFSTTVGAGHFIQTATPIPTPKSSSRIMPATSFHRRRATAGRLSRSKISSSSIASDGGRESVGGTAGGRSGVAAVARAATDGRGSSSGGEGKVVDGGFAVAAMRG
jgi:hypothetical protein